MEAPGLLDLDDHGRRRIMLALPVPDLLRLSAACRGLRSDLFRLMRGDLAVQLSLSLPSSSPAPSTAVERHRANEASFRAFLAAGGAAMVKSLALGVDSDPDRGAGPLEWQLLPALEILIVISKIPSRDGRLSFLGLGVRPVIAAARQLRELHFSFRTAHVQLVRFLSINSSTAGTGASNISDTSMEVHTAPHKLPHVLWVYTFDQLLNLRCIHDNIAVLLNLLTVGCCRRATVSFGFKVE